MTIYTITLNPAYDVHAEAKKLEIGHENFANITRRDAGGKGINISRALAFNSIDNTAIVVLGQENCTDFKSALIADGINFLSIEKSGRIRENLTIHTDSGETRISFAGFTVDNAVFDEISEYIKLDRDSIITFTGSVPKGVDMFAIKEFLSDLRSRGARIVIDSRSFTLRDIVELKPWMIKPNSEEIAEYSGKTVSSFSDCLEFAKEINRQGIENVMISLGEQGAMLVNKEVSAIAVPPRIEALSTIGAGDSSIAGFISAFADGECSESCLCRAVAFGTAACLSAGTTPPTSENIAQILKEVVIKKL